VADAAPVIACARIGRLALLRQVVEELVVPDAVYDHWQERYRTRKSSPPQR
jgi:predicted nucleic acid-binding protein